jgi:hypothetical protein
MSSLAEEIAQGDGRPIREALVAAGLTVPSISTLSRWVNHGLQGRDGQLHRVEAVEIRGRLLSSKAAVVRWITALAIVHPTRGPLAVADA